jgi:hypothetical protein
MIDVKNLTKWYGRVLAFALVLGRRLSTSDRAPFDDRPIRSAKGNPPKVFSGSTIRF